MPNDSRFSKLPNRIIVPIQPIRRRATGAEILISFVLGTLLAMFVIAVAVLIPHARLSNPTGPHPQSTVYQGGR